MTASCEGRAEFLLGGGLTLKKTLAFAAACGVMVANLYYAQTLIGPIGADLHIEPALGGLIVTLTQLGYGVGLLTIVSLADLVENRSLIIATSIALTISLIAAAISTSSTVFFLCSFLIGLTSVSAQILVPMATFMTLPQDRGKAIGNIMSGLLLGIMLARPAASFVGGATNWRLIFWLSAALVAALTAIVARLAPRRHPTSAASYRDVLTSTLRLPFVSVTLRRRAFYQGCMFAGFNLFWTSAPLMLRHSFGLSQSGVALFALAGAGGALSAPLAGRIADRGLTSIGTAVAMAVAVVALLAAGWAGSSGRLLTCAGAAIVLDAAIQSNHVISQRLVLSASAADRGRMNSAYMTMMFLSGAAGSALGAFIFITSGWMATMATGAAIGCAALLVFVTEFL